jgi:hypothetical protein
LIDAARAVGDRLQELAFGGHEDASWIGLVQSSESAWGLSPLGTDLYDGLPGVILFLAYLGSLTGDGRYPALAASALTTLRRQLKKNQEPNAIGGFTGLGGIIYLLAHLGVVWDEPSMFADAENLLDRVADAIARDKALDVIGGAAGCALSLRSMLRCRPSARILDIARACGETSGRFGSTSQTGSRLDLRRYVGVPAHWLRARRIVEQEQKGSTRASYGEELVAKLARDLTAHFGRGFHERTYFRCGSSFLRIARKIHTPSELSAPDSIIQTAFSPRIGPADRQSGVRMSASKRDGGDFEGGPPAGGL